MLKLKLYLLHYGVQITFSGLSNKRWSSLRPNATKKKLWCAVIGQFVSSLMLWCPRLRIHSLCECLCVSLAWNLKNCKSHYTDERIRWNVISYVCVCVFFFLSTSLAKLVRSLDERIRSSDMQNFHVCVLFLRPLAIFLGQTILRDVYKTNMYVTEAAAFANWTATILWKV